MRNTLIITFALLLSNLFGQFTDKNITIGKIDTLFSKELGENRRIMVHVPDNDPAFTKQTFPVMYLFDGPAHFTSMVGLMQQLSQSKFNTILPPMIIVGIINTNRTRDLSPTKDGEKFINFIEKELIPFVNKNYPTAPYKTIIGHSLGGLAVTNILLNHPTLFDSYVAIDPSLSFDNQTMLKQSKQAFVQNNYTGKNFFLAIANMKPKANDTLKIRKDTSGASLHTRSIFNFADNLKLQKSNLNWSSKYYKNDNHGSVPHIAEYDGLCFLFSYHKYPDYVYDDKYDSDSVLTKHFDNISKQMGYKVAPPEQLINSIGWSYIDKKNIKKAFELFSFNVRNYPESANTNDAIGYIYDIMGDKQKAVEYYTKTLSIKELPETRKALDAIKNKK